MGRAGEDWNRYNRRRENERSKVGLVEDGRLEGDEINKNNQVRKGNGWKGEARLLRF